MAMDMVRLDLLIISLIQCFIYFEKWVNKEMFPSKARLRIMNITNIGEQTFYLCKHLHAFTNSQGWVNGTYGLSKVSLGNEI